MSSFRKAFLGTAGVLVALAVAATVSDLLTRRRPA